MARGGRFAVDNGCLCPVLDNNHGFGFETKEGQMWVINEECPIHGKNKPQETK